MKNVCIMFLLSIFCCSCEQHIAYSCNESINEWVCDNYEEIQTMSRLEWNNLDEDFKIPVYRAFSLQQKVAFWNERLTEVLSLEWSEAESNHIQSLICFINEHQHFLDGYNSLSDDEKNTFDLFFYKWMDMAKSEFKWTDNLLYGILASGNKLIDNKGTLWVNKVKTRTAFFSNSESNCNCSQSSDWCTPSGWHCENVPCNVTSLGCGTVLVYDCDGRCGGI